MPGIIYIVVYRNNTRYYITHNITFDLQKTRGRSPPPLSKKTRGQDRGPVVRVPTIAAASRIFGRWGDRDSDTEQNVEHSFIHIFYDHK